MPLLSSKKTIDRKVTKSTATKATGAGASGTRDWRLEEKKQVMTVKRASVARAAKARRKALFGMLRGGRVNPR